MNELRARASKIHSWLEENAPYIFADQRHLDEHTPERAYWHHGYLAALRDSEKFRQNTGDPAIMQEIEVGLARMRAEAGIPQPSRMPRLAFYGFLFAFAIVGAVVLGVAR